MRSTSSARVGAELAQQKASARRQQLHIVDHQILAQHEVDKQAVETFQADRLVCEHRGHMIGGDERIVEAERHQAAMLRARLQLAYRFEDRDAGAFSCRPARGPR